MNALESQINPKSLDLEALKIGTAKVTLGVRCSPIVKLKLAHEAHRLGLTLSEYVENLIGNSDKISSENHNRIQKELAELKQVISEQQKTIDHYQKDPVLLALLEQHKNQTVAYVNKVGETVKIKLVDIPSVFAVVVSSFSKTKKA